MAMEGQESIKKPKLLYVEDDVNLGFVTSDNLIIEGFDVTLCTDGLKALETFQSGFFDLCILDVMLPGLDGFDLARQIRAQNNQIPILFLTARGMKEDRLEGLRTGADDYLSKPFSLEELNLKIRIFLRRSQSLAPEPAVEMYYLERFVLDFTNMKLVYKHSGAKTVQNLTVRETELMRLFFKKPNILIQRQEILTQLWGKNDYFHGRSLDVFITKLRKYLSADPRIKIENVPRAGFVLKVEDATADPTA